MVLIDNSGASFIFQINNGIPIQPFINDKKDKELLSLIPFLLSLKQRDI